MTNPDSFQLWQSSQGHLPLVFDSPHSSAHFPDTFATLATESELKSGWDAFVDELWLPAVELGASLLAAKFSRMYIDPNRAVTDIDPEMLAEPWLGDIQPTQYSERGMGLLRRYALPGKPMYAELLPIAEVEARIERFYLPYHRCLHDLLDLYSTYFTGVWHIDCHSMKSKGNAMNIDAGTARPDIVLGDADGTTADPEFTAVIQNAFEGLGYKVAVNYPYKGGHCIRAYGDPRRNRHSVQIEINRALYMNEAAFEKSDNFDAFQQDLRTVAQSVAEYVKSKI